MLSRVKQARPLVGVLWGAQLGSSSLPKHRKTPQAIAHVVPTDEGLAHQPSLAWHLSELRLANQRAHITNTRRWCTEGAEA